MLYSYARTGELGAEPLRSDWDQISGARGCIPQACDFRDHAAELAELGAAMADVFTQHTGYQAEVAARLSLAFLLLSDAQLQLATAMRLPTFDVAGQTLLRRLTLIVRGGRIEHVWYADVPAGPTRRAGTRLAARGGVTTPRLCYSPVRTVTAVIPTYSVMWLFAVPRWLGAGLVEAQCHLA